MRAENRNNGTRNSAIARQRHGKHFFAATNEHETIEELFEAVFSVLSVPRLHREDQREKFD
jgi:hypothetical protein